MLAAHLNMQAKKTPNPLEPLPLAEVLLKCKQEDGLEKEDQPLFIDWHDDVESIKCRWCRLFKGSIEPRVITQHVKAAKTPVRMSSSAAPWSTNSRDAGRPKLLS